MSYVTNHNHRKDKAKSRELKDCVTVKDDIVSDRFCAEVKVENEDSGIPVLLKNIESSLLCKQSSLSCDIKLNKKTHRKVSSRKRRGSVADKDTILLQRLCTEVNINNENSESSSQLQNIENTPHEHRAINISKKSHRNSKRSRKQGGVVTDKINIVSKKLCIEINDGEHSQCRQSSMPDANSKLYKQIQRKKSRKLKYFLANKNSILLEQRTEVTVNNNNSEFSTLLHNIEYSPTCEQSNTDYKTKLDKKNHKKGGFKKLNDDFHLKDYIVSEGLCVNANNENSESSILLQNIEFSACEQSNMSFVNKLDKKMYRTDNRLKKRNCVANIDNTVSKKLCTEVNITDSEFPINECAQNLSYELHNACQINQYRKHFPHSLIRLMYQLDLSVLYLFRKFTYENKYPSLSLAFQYSETDKFNDIVLCYENKSILIQIEYIYKYTFCNITYEELFAKRKHSFSIHSYFDSFVKRIIFKAGSLLNDFEYLVIYTNLSLDLTEENIFKQGHLRNFYPFKLDRINMEECAFLNDFLCTINMKKCSFYKFLQDELTGRELLKQLEFSSAMKKVMKENNLSQEFENEIKQSFFDKLVFAVNQPNREELNRIIKNEMGSKVQYDLRKKILNRFTAPKNYNKFITYVPGFIYDLNLLMSFLHDMFLNKNIFSIHSEGEIHNASNDFIIHYKHEIMYIKAHTTVNAISYSQLFPSKERNNIFCINKCFALFEELRADIKYFIIYTTADLKLTEEKRFKKGISKDFYPIKFDKIDIQKERFKIFTDYMCINENGLYQFAKEKATRNKLLGLLKLSPFQQKESALSYQTKNERKEQFINKLIFAVNQPHAQKLNCIVKNEIKKNCNLNKVPYNYEELCEIALRWAESQNFGPVTETVMKHISEDIKNNRLSYQKVQNKNINEEVKFAKSVVGTKGTSAFDQYLDFLIKGKGKKYLETMRKKGISLTNVSSCLRKAGTKAFDELYNLWFDTEGNETQYLRTLEKEEINLTSMSSILTGSRTNILTAFKDLYDLWFDEEGNKTQYLKTLERNGIKLSNISSILNGSGANASKAFIELFDLWFDVEGEKTQYFKFLEVNRINLRNISSILSGARANAPQAFKDLYDLWLDVDGNETQYFKFLLEEKIVKLNNISSMLNRAGANASKTVKDLYDLWFDAEKKKTQYLKTLEKKGISLSNMSSILCGAGSKTPQAFKDLYDLWFDAEGNKTQYLKSLEQEGVHLTVMSTIIHGSGAKAPKAFKDMFNLWFDPEGNKTLYLKALEKEGICLAHVSSILSGARTNAPKAAKDLYDLWFDIEGNKTQYLKSLKKEGVNLTIMSSILSGAGSKAPKAFKDLYDLWFDAKGNKMENLKALEKEKINLVTMSSILSGAGAKAAESFKELYYSFFDMQGGRKQYLKHFIENDDRNKRFTLRNLSAILCGAASNAKGAFEKLHSVCFDNEGKETDILEDFYCAGFRPSNLSVILGVAGVRAAPTLKKLHSICFNAKRKKTRILDDFYNVGFRPCDLCSILTGSADNLKTFHEFCFIEETRKYLCNFLNGGFRPKHLSIILGGAKANIFSAFKNFHDICFDEAGNKTRLLLDFHNADFMASSLSRILSRTKNNATSILKKFHKMCFNKKKYLNHFLAEEHFFTSKSLSRILYRVGINICSIFKRLHNLCFDKLGNKTDYFNNLLGYEQQVVFSTLYEKVRGSHT